MFEKLRAASPAFLALLLAAPLWAASPLLDPPVTDWEGRTLTADTFRHRVTVVIISGEDFQEVGSAVDDSLLAQFRDEPHFQLLRIVDLVGVPPAASETVVEFIKQDEAAQQERLKTRLSAEGRPPAPQAATVLRVLDWEAKVKQALLRASPRPEYAIFAQEPPRSRRFKTPQEQQREQLANHLHVFVLDGNGEIKAHYLDSEGANAALDVRAMLPPAIGAPVPAVPPPVTAPAPAVPPPPVDAPPPPLQK